MALGDIIPQLNLDDLDAWTQTVGRIFDNGYGVYERMRGRIVANEILKSDQVPIPDSELPNQGQVFAEAVVQEVKRPLMLAAIGIVIIGIVLIYKR